MPQSYGKHLCKKYEAQCGAELTRSVISVKILAPLARLGSVYSGGNKGNRMTVVKNRVHTLSGFHMY